MKVDENYHYDELEGFEEVKLDQRCGAQGDLWLSMSASHISMAKAVRDIVMSTGYLRFLYNKQTRQILLVSSPGPDENVVKLHPTAIRNGFACHAIVELISAETRRDLHTVRVRFYGQKVKSKRGAVVFDLSSMIVRKIEKQNKKAK